MDSMKGKGKKFPGLKKLLLSLTAKSSIRSPHLSKSKAGRGQVAPDGCFSVYVGAEKQRFVIKTEYANHPLFKILLEDAESEYGFNSEGPIKLPCDVDLFYKVLAEMDCGNKEDDQDQDMSFVYGSYCCSPFTPPRRWRNNSYGGSYGLLTPSHLLKMNHM